LKNDVKVPSKSTMRKTSDPDPHQNVMDPEHFPIKDAMSKKPSHATVLLRAKKVVCSYPEFMASWDWK
jgi:hypothetical protein